MLQFLPATSRPLRVALVGAHCDDVEIGCGGMLLDLAQQGLLGEADVLVASSDPLRGAECRASLADFCAPARCTVTLGELPDGRLPGYWNEAKDLLQRFAKDSRAELVLAPSPTDAHQDHRLLGELVRTAFRDHVVLHYEIPKWDGDLGAGRPQVYWPLPESLVRRKYALLEKHYVSQRGHNWFREDTFAALARLRGLECRSDYAEAFGCPAMVLSAAPPAYP